MTAGPSQVAEDEVELLRLYLADRDVACPQCKYNLRNLIGTRCPECGEQLQLRVTPVEPRQAAPIAGLILLAAGGGMNGMLLIYVIMEALSRRGGGGGWLGRFV